MPYIKKRGITYGGFPNATVASKEATAIVPSSIKQLTRVGGTQEFAPVTIPEAVKFSEGGSLETTVNSIATIESSSTASKAYVVGDFLVSGGQLYKVIADIAIGETFVVDTNIESTSVGSELSALNAGLSALEGIGDYSTTEKAIGTWIDGRTVYHRVVELDSDINISPTSWTAINALPLSTYKHILNIRGYTSTLNNMWNLLTATDSGPSVRLLVARDGQSVNVRTLVVEYLKD